MVHCFSLLTLWYKSIGYLMTVADFREKHYGDYESCKAAWKKRKQLIKIHKQIEKSNQQSGESTNNDNQSTTKQGISTNSACGK